MMLSQVVMVEKEKLLPCITCPLCNNLFRDATTISECLHTFCRKCIYKKITEEELDTCPVCNINLGCAPLEKLRVDHCLQDLKAKLFPSKKEKAKSPEPVAPLQSRRKERSISSLVVSTPRVIEKSFSPRKRLKSLARKYPGLHKSNHADGSGKKVDNSLAIRLISPQKLCQIEQTKEQAQNYIPESSKQHKSNEDNTEESFEPCEGNADLCQPLSCLVEAASKSKSNKTGPPETLVKMQLPLLAEKKQVEAPKAEVDVNGNKSEVNIDQNKNKSQFPSPATNSVVKTKKLQCIQAAVSEGLDIPAQAVVNATRSKFDRRFSPIWFSLVASNNQEGNAPLPQISSCYLRIKNGNLTVSSIKKYLVQKLGLASEAEVEISLHCQPVSSTLQMHHLVEWWLQKAPTSEIIQTTVGSSAKDFVMVLSYARKASASNILLH